MLRYATGPLTAQALASSRAPLAGAPRRAPSPPAPRRTRAATDQPVAGPTKRSRCPTPPTNRQPRKKVKTEPSSSTADDTDSVPFPDKRWFSPLENSAFEHWHARTQGRRLNNNKQPLGHPMPPLASYKTEFELSIDAGVELVLQRIEDRLDGGASDDDGSLWGSATGPRAWMEEDGQDDESAATHEWWDDDSFLDVYRHMRPDRRL